jgi:hypothetical protein
MLETYFSLGTFEELLDNPAGAKTTELPVVGPLFRPKEAAVQRGMAVAARIAQKHLDLAMPSSGGSIFWPYFNRKWVASTGMSSAQSFTSGSTMGMTLSRCESVEDSWASLGKI